MFGMSLEGFAGKTVSARYIDPFRQRYFQLWYSNERWFYSAIQYSMYTFTFQDAYDKWYELPFGKGIVAHVHCTLHFAAVEGSPGLAL